MNSRVFLSILHKFKTASLFSKHLKRDRLPFSENGFTLMEILIAVAVLAIGVVGVVNMFPVGLQAARRTADFTKVALLVQGATEFYRSEGYGYIDDLFNNPPHDVDTEEAKDFYDVSGNRHRFIRAPDMDADHEDRAGGIQNTTLFAGAEDYYWRLVISEDVEVGGGDPDEIEIYKITLHIYWLDGGQEQWDFFETHIANYD